MRGEHDGDLGAVLNAVLDDDYARAHAEVTAGDYVMIAVGGLTDFADGNNATDGDLLIAYALAKAGEVWQEPRYTTEAQKLAKAIGKNTFGRSGRSRCC